MPTQEKTPEEVAANLLANEERIENVNVVIYKIDVEKVREFGYEGITDLLNILFGTLAIDASDDGTIERMFLDSELGQISSRDDEKVDILHQE